MATFHAASGDLIDIRPFGKALMQAKSATLARTEHLELFRLVLLAGKKLPQHQVASVITVQCLEWAVEFETPWALSAHARRSHAIFGSRRTKRARTT